MLLAFLQGEPPLALGLSTQKALSILKEQLEAVLDGHQKEREKCVTWKVGQGLAGVAGKCGSYSQGPASPCRPGCHDPTEASLKIRKRSGFLSERCPDLSWSSRLDPR